MTSTSEEPDESGAAGAEASADALHFVDAATRVSRPSAFDDWYYGIEDMLGQGTVGMGVCFVLFIVVLALAMIFAPI